ncbi:hypothetical protein [Halorubrum sp. AJ67]|uniref:hypothetical protein n=1 Tax=Halorubrum sp. AJ67 TaxID=1173487 RepID=UPI0003DD6325|nr:hypothetical protein [Halorubrum sp. AJ67]CDK38236.1 hypothetical protein BN903_436 [Halorubrum sp. AJ67]
MSTPQEDTVDVRTTTDYGTHSLNSENVVAIYIECVDIRTASTFAEQLSRTLETNDADPFLQVLGIFTDVTESPVEKTVGIQPVDETPPDCRWPVEVEIEGVDSELAHRMVTAGRKMGSSLMGIAEFRSVLEKATADQPRSIVRVAETADDLGSTMEWHADTDADWNAVEV